MTGAGISVPPLEGNPGDVRATLSQQVAQLLGLRIGEHRVLRSVTLEDRQPAAVRDERRPVVPCHQRPREEGDPGERSVRAQGHVAGEHGPLREAAQNDLGGLQARVELVEQGDDVGVGLAHPGRRVALLRRTPAALDLHEVPHDVDLPPRAAVGAHPFQGQRRGRKGPARARRRRDDAPQRRQNRRPVRRSRASARPALRRRLPHHPSRPRAARGARRDPAASCPVE